MLTEETLLGAIFDVKNPMKVSDVPLREGGPLHGANIASFNSGQTSVAKQALAVCG